jgi:hypothetical protein
LLAFLETEERLEAVRSRVGSEGSLTTTTGVLCILEAFCASFTEDEALAGRDFGEDSPDIVSCPKKDHFLADFGVDGPDPDAFTTSDSNGREPRRLGAASVGFNPSRSSIGSAVRGRGSASFGSGRSPVLFTVTVGGDGVPPETIEDMEFDTEWPGRTVELESLDTNDSGRGII